MSIETKSSHSTPVGGNLFSDLGFQPEEAAALQAESRRVIEAPLAMNEALTTEGPNGNRQQAAGETE